MRDELEHIWFVAGMYYLPMIVVFTLVAIVAWAMPPKHKSKNMATRSAVFYFLLLVVCPSLFYWATIFLRVLLTIMTYRYHG